LCLLTLLNLVYHFIHKAGYCFEQTITHGDRFNLPLSFKAINTNGHVYAIYKILYPVDHLTLEFAKKPVALVMKIESPMQTLQRIIDFFSARKIYVESMQMQMVEGGNARLIVYCQVEKDRIKYTQYGLERMKGILELEFLESKGRDTLKNPHP
jgi:hypothetical protein